MSADLALQNSQPTSPIQPGMKNQQNLDDYLEDIERGLIIDALEACGFNKTRAAERLGISFRSIRYKMKKLNIESNGQSGTKG